MDAETKEQFRELQAGNEKLLRELRAENEKLLRELWSDLSGAIRGSEARLSKRMDDRFDALETRVTALEAELATFKRVAIESFARVKRNFEDAQRNLKRVLAAVNDPDKQARLERLEERIARLEQHVGLPDE